MSWSTIHLGEVGAHAHDSEQEMFMFLVPLCMDSLKDFRQPPWIQDWKAYWCEHRESYGNGCSDIRLDVYLTNTERVSKFRKFLAAYQEWLSSFGKEISAEFINSKLSSMSIQFTRPISVESIQAFASKIEAVLIQDLSHDSVFLLRQE